VNRILAAALCVGLSRSAWPAQIPEAAVQNAINGATVEFPTGKLVPKVTCKADPQQSYALYLPSSFSSARKWPIIYVFDPAARGQVAAETIRAAAEKFGYIIAASNNSRNGSGDGSSKAANAMWNDTQERLSIDERRRYFAGMSGGARVAAAFALSCDCVAGVIANAAGFPASGPPRSLKFNYFAAVGNADFNYAEFVQLRPKLDEASTRYHIRIFEGTHGWAPAEVWVEALSWMDLQAMAAGAIPRDQARIGEALAGALERSQAFDAKNEYLNAVREYRSVVRDFSDLADVSVAKSRLAELEKNKAVKAAEKTETAEIERQAQIEAAPSRLMQKISAGGMDPSELGELRGTIADLKRQALGSNGSPLATRRALGGLVVQAYESGQRSLEQKDYRAALIYFDLVAAGARDPSGAHYERARAYAMISDKKNMLAELRLCLAGDFHDAAALDAAEFHAYHDQPEFRALTDEWKRKARP
jgi:predicted esterase